VPGVAHRRATLAACLRLFADDGSLSDLDKCFFSAKDNETRFANFLDLSYHTTIRDDLIIDLKGGDHLGELLPLPLLRKDDQKIKDREDQYERKEKSEAA
jgi:hypothetical protein